MIRRYAQLESHLDAIWPLLLAQAQHWKIALSTSSWRSSPWRDVRALLRRSHHLPKTWECPLGDMLAGKCLTVLARCAHVSTRHLSRLRAAALNGTGCANPTTATYCKVLFAAGFGIPFDTTPGEAIESGLPSAEATDSSHRTENTRGRPRQGEERHDPPSHDHRSDPNSRPMSPPPSRVSLHVLPNVLTNVLPNVAVNVSPQHSHVRPLSGGSGGSSGGSGGSAGGSAGDSPGGRRPPRRLAPSGSNSPADDGSAGGAHPMEICPKGHVFIDARGINSPLNSSPISDGVVYAAGSPRIWGVDCVGVMAEFDFKDLTKGPDNDLRGSSSAEGASPRQTNTEMLLGGLAKSVAQMVAFQVQQAANAEAAQRRREEAEAKQEQQAKRAVEMHLDLAREMGAHVKEMSMLVDQRFDALAKSQEALPIRQQALQKVVEVASVAIALWKRKLALEEEKHND